MIIPNLPVSRIVECARIIDQGGVSMVLNTTARFVSPLERLKWVACRVMLLASKSKAQHLIDPSSPALSTRLVLKAVREMNVVKVIIATNC